MSGYIGVSLRIIQGHPCTSLWRVYSGLWSALETAAYPAVAFSGLRHGSVPVPHIFSLPYRKFPLAVVFIASTLCLGSVPSRCSSHLFPSPSRCRRCWWGTYPLPRVRFPGSEERKQSKWQVGRKEGRCKEVVKLYPASWIPLLCIFWSLGLYGAGPALQREWECSRCGGVKAVLRHVDGRHHSWQHCAVTENSVSSTAVIKKLCLFLQG